MNEILNATTMVEASAPVGQEAPEAIQLSEDLGLAPEVIAQEGITEAAPF